MLHAVHAGLHLRHVRPGNRVRRLCVQLALFSRQPPTAASRRCAGSWRCCTDSEWRCLPPRFADCDASCLFGPCCSYVNGTGPDGALPAPHRAYPHPASRSLQPPLTQIVAQTTRATRSTR